MDERYYARRTHADGSEQWYRVADDVVVGRRKRETRVLPLRRRGGAGVSAQARRVVVLGSSRSGRTILVGTSRRRRPDAAQRDTGER